MGRVPDEMRINMEHLFDPTETIRGIQQLLVSDKKRIGFLFGAGTSLSKKNEHSPTIPAIQTMTEVLEKKLNENAVWKDALAGIREDVADSQKQFTVETLLSNVEEKLAVIGRGTLNGLKREQLAQLDFQIKEIIREIVSVHNSITIESHADMVQCDFANWIKGADRKYGVEVFTTNYDYLFEIGLEHHHVPYYDGFTGSYKPFFYPESLEEMSFLSRQTKLWKIHGSLGLMNDKETGRIIRCASSNDDLMIYPSSLKYNDSRKEPYASFMDRLNSFLKQDDAVLFVCGYSFGDEHINERILSALNTETTAHVFVLHHDRGPYQDGVRTITFTTNCQLAMMAKKCRKISVLSNRGAVIGGKYGIWKLKREPDNDATIDLNTYFDEDAANDTEIPLHKENQGNETWTGQGDFIITDFGKFTSFLLNMIPQDD